jgi:hypothetical protein
MLNSEELASELAIIRGAVERLRNKEQLPVDVRRLVTAVAILDEAGVFNVHQSTGHTTVVPQRLYAEMMTDNHVDPNGTLRDAAMHAQQLIMREELAMRKAEAERERKRREEKARKRAQDAAQGIRFDATVHSTPDISSYSPSCDTSSSSSSTDCSSL